ncbi:MAG: hypothetical protein ACSHWQ_08250 [Spongiibacteraceae bacterium]
MLSYLELVELANGDIVLQKSESDDKPLVVIQFSEEARKYIVGSSLEVARAMVQAGIEAASTLTDDETGEVDDDGIIEFDDDGNKTIH